MNHIPNELRVGRAIVIPKRLNSRKNQIKKVSTWKRNLYGRRNGFRTNFPIRTSDNQIKQQIRNNSGVKSDGLWTGRVKSLGSATSKEEANMAKRKLHPNTNKIL